MGFRGQGFRVQGFRVYIRLRVGGLLKVLWDLRGLGFCERVFGRVLSCGVVRLMQGFAWFLWVAEGVKGFERDSEFKGFLSLDE